jgi:ribosomal protein S18 acetylase RimI-like enzyme
MESVGIEQLMPAEEKEALEVLAQAFTLPAYQGRGLGRQVLRYVCKVAASKGYAGVQLVTTSQNESAVRLYREEGFVVEQEYKLGSESFYFMALTLTANQT